MGYTIPSNGHVPGDTGHTTDHNNMATDLATLISHVADGLTGAAAAARFAGGTASGAPASGTFAVGDFVVDQSGAVWVCTAAGAPGTWVSPGGFSNPMSTLGDAVYGGASGAATRLAGNTTSTKKFFTQTGTGSVSAAPGWNTIAAADLPSLDAITAPAGNVSLNSHKITSLANGSASTDAAAFGQIPVVNSTAATIAVDGDQAAGASAQVAAADHVHPAFSWTPNDNGLLVANFDPGVAGTTLTLTGGTVYAIRWNIHRAMTISNLWPMVVTVGVGASTGSFMGLYNSSGTKLQGSADCATAFTTQGGTAVPITSQALTAGTAVWVLFLCNLASTQVTLLRGTGNGFSANVNLTAAQSRQAVVSTGQTALPASFTPSSLTATGSAHLWSGGS